MLKLLPCPFFGAIPDVVPKHPKKEGNAWGAVRCIEDDCPPQPYVDDGESIIDDRGSDAYKEAAIKRWNRRAK